MTRDWSDFLFISLSWLTSCLCSPPASVCRQILTGANDAEDYERKSMRNDAKQQQQQPVIVDWGHFLVIHALKVLILRQISKLKEYWEQP